jgi:hypothetical protein
MSEITARGGMKKGAIVKGRKDPNRVFFPNERR